MIHCVCESCSAAVEVSENYAGSRIACKSCKAIMRVPAAGSANGAGAPKPAAPATPPATPKPPAAPQAAAKPPVAPAPAAKLPAPKPAPAPQPQTKAPTPAAPQPPAKAPAPQPQAKAPAPTAQPPAKPAPAKPAPVAPPEPVATLVMVEAVQFKCTPCGNVLQVWPEQVGMTMNCPYCQASLNVPAPVAAAPPPMQARPAPVKSAGSHQNVPVKSAPTHQNVPIKSSGSNPKAPHPAAKPGAAKKGGFRFPCEKCKAMIQADSSQVGLMIVCPQCKHDMDVPEPA